MSLALPRRALVEPPVIETFGCPEFYISGTVAIIEPEIVHIICYADRISVAGDRMERIEVLRCHIPRAHYAANLLRAFERASGAMH